MKNLKELFTNTYVNNGWTQDGSISGLGSSLPYTENIRKVLVDIIKQNGIKTIWDCSCGDWHWMKEIKDELPNYIGNDIVDRLVEINNETYGSDTIRFQCGDMLEELRKLETMSIDLILCRHTLEHLPSDYAIDVVKEIHRVSKHSLITSNLNGNSEIDANGQNSRPIDLEKNEYFAILGKPIQRYYDTNGTPVEGVYGINLYENWHQQL
jgi:2-polyprenyl-3-methyl-5-hydroxy-6-metoxy-1,4-benzoquinol methylase